MEATVADRNETCPTCGSSHWWVYITPCDGGIHDGWHAPDNHPAVLRGTTAAPTPAPRDEVHGEVVLWRYGTELFDTRRPPPEVEHYEYVAVPAAQRERERAEVRELREALKLLLAAASEFKSVPGWRDGPRHDAIDRACIQADAALRRGESKED